MLVRFTKSPAAAAADMLTCVRPDGSTTSLDMPRQGILPHEAFHFVVEGRLAWRDAFFGRIAQGRSAEDVRSLLHGEGVQWNKIAQGLQAESLIECLQAEQWGGATNPAEFAQKLVASCHRRGVPPPDLTADELDVVRVALREFGAAWRPLAAGASLERTF
jgi:hypothetical protein